MLRFSYSDSCRALFGALLALMVGSAPLVSAGDGGDTFIRGDSNNDGAVDIGDPVHTLAFLFSMGADPACFDAADSNDDGTVDIGDPVSTLGHLFSMTGDLPPPFPLAGNDLTMDGMLCGPGCTDIWYLDFDMDGAGDPGLSVVACVAPAGYVDNGDDCDDSDDSVYPLAPELCDGIDNDCDLDIDEGNVCVGATSLQIIAARAALDGPVTLPISGALVTKVKPTFGSDVAGFFIQSEATGPALYVAVDPATLAPSPTIGDTVSFTIDNMATAFGLRQADAISNYTVDAIGDASTVSFLIQDLNGIDLVTQLDDLESELISIDLTITGAFASAGGGFLSAAVDSAVVIGSPNLRLRLEASLVSSLLLGPGCQVTVTAPLWRFNAQAQASGWSLDDLIITSCPAATLTGAVASSSTEVTLQFDRLIDAASVTSPGTQFIFSGGLTATAAAVSGSTITLTTTAQTGGLSYDVTVAATVLDEFGQGVDALANSASFLGFSMPAVVRLNELNANISGGCDLIELRVIQGGSMDGFSLMERDSTVLTFAGLTVLTNDSIVVHFDANDLSCNPMASGNETTSKSEFPAATHPQNFDAAYDWYTTDTGITGTDNVLTLLDPLGGIMDAVLVSDDVTGTAAAASEAQAAVVAAVGEWTTILGMVPPGGFVDDDFSANAVQDLNATGTDASGTSIQRSDDSDTNHLGGWTMGASSWGANNAGQLDF